MAQTGRKPTARELAKKAQSDAPVVVEWIIAGVSALVVIMVVGFLIHDAVTRDGGLPALVTEIGATHPVEGGGYMVEVDVRNLGHATAAAVQVEGTITLPDGTTETSQASLDYAPAQSRRQVTLVFRADPGAGALAVRPIGFTEP